MQAYSFLEFLELPIKSSNIQSDEEFAFSYTDEVRFNLEESEILISKVKIPMIQRDFAQGRQDKLELRTQFVNDLFKALEGKKDLNLDFIYGSISNDKENAFLPLDGQQRLTTLFLLHWLIIQLEVEKSEHFLLSLQKFSYETRDSARKFFQNLSSFSFNGDPINSIIESLWFKDSYMLDPTISAALNMLDTIYQRYQKSEQKGCLFKQLDNLRFYVLQMNNLVGAVLLCL